MPVHQTPKTASGLVTLSSVQLKAFDHDEFVEDQANGFRRLVASFHLLADLGGGTGHFGRAIQEAYGRPVRVVDLDPVAVEKARSAGLDARTGDVLTTREGDDADVVSLNLVLHHLVGRSFSATHALQLAALRNQLVAGRNRRIFVHEYCYESWCAPELGSALIYAITSSRLLSAAALRVARFVPALSANTFGTGVRFHSTASWSRLFEEAGWRVVQADRGVDEPIHLARRLAFVLRSCHRTSFLLEPA